MPKLTEATKRERVRQISAAAARCFARNGFAGTSIADIVAEAGLSAGSIYSHFESKTELLQQVAGDMLALPDGLGEAGFASPGEAATAFARHVDFTPDFARVLLQVWAESTRDPELAQIANANVTRIRAWLGSGLHEWADAHGVDHEAATDLTFALLQGFIARIAMDSQVHPAKLLASLSATVDA